jgi:hypothetical protein
MHVNKKWQSEFRLQHSLDWNCFVTVQWSPNKSKEKDIELAKFRPLLFTVHNTLLLRFVPTAEHQHLTHEAKRNALNTVSNCQVAQSYWTVEARYHTTSVRRLFSTLYRLRTDRHNTKSLQLAYAVCIYVWAGVAQRVWQGVEYPGFSSQQEQDICFFKTSIQALRSNKR